MFLAYNKRMNNDIEGYNNNQQSDHREICERLAVNIKRGLPEAEGKIWHGSPVWFLDGNPIVGYDVLKNSVRMLFWSGQSFDEPSLHPEGSYKAAEVRYTNINQVDSERLQAWLKKSRDIQWDYKNIVKRKGKLERIK